VYSSKTETHKVFKAACREIIEELMAIPLPDKKDANRLKAQVCRKFHVKYPSNSELIKLLEDDERGRLLPILRLKPVRTISGVNIVTVMTKPWPCPKAEPCIYCPGGLASGTPQSYTGREPAALRGLQHGFDPYEQVRSRIRQLREIGHEVSKIELIILGGTFTAMPVDYRLNFVKRCFGRD
jgi:elongator complex protein 3